VLSLYTITTRSVPQMDIFVLQMLSAGKLAFIKRFFVADILFNVCSSVYSVHAVRVLYCPCRPLNMLYVDLTVICTFILFYYLLLV
jgi:hypothetical protein